MRSLVARVFRRAPLRVRLVAATVVLVMIAVAGSGFAAATTLRTYLVHRVDTQLAAAKNPIAEHELGSVTKRGSQTQRSDQYVLPSAFVVEVTDAHGRTVYRASNLVDPRQPLPRLPDGTGSDARADGTRRFTVPAVDGEDQWRVLATPITLADGSAGTLLIAQSLHDVQTTIGRFGLLFLGIGGAAMIIVAGVGYVVVRVSLRPLRDVERTAGRIAGGDLSCRVPDRDPRTEVGQLSSALNTMLAEIERAFADRAASEDRMRRFVADASHELRTPLTSIRGFAELHRQGAVSEPEDVRRAMVRIESEAKRMGLLVQDLLTLARLDQERPLDRAPVDLLALAGDAALDARATDPTREIRLEIAAPDAPPVVIGDEPRLRQVLANLVTNALQHTPPGSPVAIRVVVEPPTDGGGTVQITVADSGPGLTAEQADHVFERFFRADTSRSAGGTGLGLAIVAALVAGHDGTVDLDTAPGAGARFRVTLPLAAPLAAAHSQPLRR